MFAIGPLTPLIIDHYDVNKSTAGFLTGVVFLVHILFGIPISMLVGRIGLKTLLTMGTLTGSVPVLTFMAMDSYSFLLILRGIYGLGFLLLLPTCGALFMQWFNPKELSIANGCFLVSVCLGTAISGFVSAPLANIVGWEFVLSGFGGVCMLSTVLWLMFGRAEEIDSLVDRPELKLSVWKIMGARNTLLISAADAGPLTLLTVSLAWLPTFYHQSQNMDLTKAGVFSGLISLVGVIALILASIMTSRVRRRRPFLLWPGLLIGFAGCSVLVLPDSIFLYAAVAVLGFCCWFYLPALFTIPMELYSDNPRRVSIIFACVLTLGGICSFVAPSVVGAIADHVGSLGPGIAIVAVFSWILAVAGLMLPETGMQKR